jgi:hypothetical protein
MGKHVLTGKVMLGRLQEAGIHPDRVTKRIKMGRVQFVCKWVYFYRHGQTIEMPRPGRTPEIRMKIGNQLVRCMHSNCEKCGQQFHFSSSEKAMERIIARRHNLTMDV